MCCAFVGGAVGVFNMAVKLNDMIDKKRKREAAAALAEAAAKDEEDDPVMGEDV